MIECMLWGNPLCNVFLWLYLSLCKYVSVPACLRDFALKHNLSPKQNTCLYWKSIKLVCVCASLGEVQAEVFKPATKGDCFILHSPASVFWHEAKLTLQSCLKDCWMLLWSNTCKLSANLAKICLRASKRRQNGSNVSTWKFNCTCNLKVVFSTGNWIPLTPGNTASSKRTITVFLLYWPNAPAVKHIVLNASANFFVVFDIILTWQSLSNNTSLVVWFSEPNHLKWQSQQGCGPVRDCP